MTVPVGVTLPQFRPDAADLIDGAERAVAAGFDSFWVFDHLWPMSGDKTRPIFECWTTIAYLVSRWPQINAGSLVTRSTMRNPAVLAKVATTVSAIAPGRMTVGIGSGDRVSKPENEAVGLPYLSGADRHEQLAAVIEVLAAAREGPVSVDRPHVSIDLPPVPRGDFSIWVGGTADAVVTTAARWADAFNIWGSPPEQVAAKRRLLDGMSAERPVGLTWGGQVITAHSDAEARSQAGDRDPRWYLIGAPTTVARRLAEVIEAGVDELVLATPFAARRDSYDLLAEVRDELTHLS